MHFTCFEKFLKGYFPRKKRILEREVMKRPLNRIFSEDRCIPRMLKIYSKSFKDFFGMS